MTHSTSDLERLLNERGQERAGGGPTAHLDRIIRRGRRIRRARRAVAAGGTLAIAVVAAGLVNGLLAGASRPDRSTVAQSPADSAQVKPAVKLPESFHVVLGGKNFYLPLLRSERFTTTGAAKTVTFTPASYYTGYKVVCDDPRAWVVIQTKLKSGEIGGTSGRCDPPSGGHHDKLSAPADWLKRPQSLKVWVFPADAPVREVAQAVAGCPLTPKSKECDDEAAAHALMRPEVLERLSSEVGERPGSWAVGVYDRPSPTPSAGS
ncbi:hypothetical protein [Nonomuraea harbinensis]|uniref:Uncharacterized protein n=1 Tax=Nonomuraea harbinensis TaxID=1286938 RepID=A0ABW1C9R8_9ACTN|nr:hypothetical protein [Nonomuraea harbinensis]